MAIPVTYAIDLLQKAGWKTPEEMEKDKQEQATTAQANTNSAATSKSN